MKSSKVGIALMVALALMLPALAQNSVPMLVNYGGVLRDAKSEPLTGVVGVTFLLYKDREGGAPLWMETQNVTPDERGRYIVTLGVTTNEGLPAQLFADGAARWLGMQVAGQAEEARVALVAVPIWLLRSLISGCSVASLAGVTWAWALAASALRLGMALVVAWSATAGSPEQSAW